MSNCCTPGGKTEPAWLCREERSQMRRCLLPCSASERLQQAALRMLESFSHMRPVSVGAVRPVERPVGARAAAVAAAGVGEDAGDAADDGKSGQLWDWLASGACGRNPSQP